MLTKPAPLSMSLLSMLCQTVNKKLGWGFFPLNECQLFETMNGVFFFTVLLLKQKEIVITQEKVVSFKNF